MRDEDKFVFTYPYKSKVSARLNPETGNYEIVGEFEKFEMPAIRYVLETTEKGKPTTRSKPFTK